MLTLEQLEFLAELLTTKGVMLARDRWRIASDTDAALQKLIAAAQAERVAAARLIPTA